MKNYKIICYFVIAFFAIFSCKESDTDTPQKGEIKIVADEAFKNVTEALTERYMAHYPKSKIIVEYKKEDSALIDLLQYKARVIVMSRDLTKKEKDLYQELIDLPLQPGKFAADALIFIVPKNSTLESISVDDIKRELHSDEKKLIFDGNNTSNINFVSQKFNLKQKDLKFSILRGNENIVNEIEKFPGKIGVISLNTISRPYDPSAIALRDKVKILPVIENNKLYEANTQNLKTLQYPFTRVLYFLTNEGYFGLGNGFIRFSCQQIGQIVVSKQGLQPYHIFKREVQMR